MQDFDKQMERYGEALRSVRYTHGEAELDRSIRRATWSDRPAANPAAPKQHTVRWLWPVSAAACLALLLIPIGLKAQPSDGISRVSVDGGQVWFACNRGCSPDGTIENMNNLIH